MTDSAGPRAARLLAEVAHTLECGDDAPGRVARVLAVLGQLVPCDRCALLQAPAGVASELRVVPEATEPERADLFARLDGFLRLLGDRAATRRDDAPDAYRRPGWSHLALPLVGLDDVVGVLLVEQRGDAAYDEQCLSLLTVVAAQLATYLTTIRLLEAQARSSRALGLAHGFQQLLVGVVSHDLRNPLGVIVGSAGMLLRRTDDPRQIKTIGRIVASAQRATRIINDLLDMTRARLGAGIPIAPRPTDLTELLRECVEEARAAHPGREVRLDAPDAVAGAWDADRLGQVVANLLANALHHGAAGAPVGVALRAGDAAVSIEVHNLGPVIPPEALPTIFDPFRRGERIRSAAQGEGLGLGLYIVQQIVEGHGGRVEVRSTAGDGTTFTVTLPR